MKNIQGASAVRILRSIAALGALLLVGAMLVATAARAQSGQSPQAAAANKGAVGVISGGISGTYIRIAADLSAALDTEGELRVIPIIGQGSVQNISDVLYMKGVDIGIVQSDVLEHLKRTGSHGDIENSLRYITKLYNEEFHLVARDDVRSVADLAGKKVNFGVEGSGTFMTASIVFNALGVNVTPTSFGQAQALDKVKSGEIAAMVYVAGKPTSAFIDVKPQDGLRLVDIDYAGALRNTYLPSTFGEQDYPGLVPPGKPVPTIAVGAVMAVFNWERDSARYNRVAQFVEAFFANFEKLQQAPRHAKWQEINLTAELPGWQRFDAASEWLEKNNTVSAEDLISAFKTFLSENGIEDSADKVSKADKEDLFRDFIQWQREKLN